MEIAVTIMIVLALLFMPASYVPDQDAKGSITVEVSNEGTRIGLDFTTPGNPRVVIEDEIYLK